MYWSTGHFDGIFSQSKDIANLCSTGGDEEKGEDKSRHFSGASLTSPLSVMGPSLDGLLLITL